MIWHDTISAFWHGGWFLNDMRWNPVREREQDNLQCLRAGFLVLLESESDTYQSCLEGFSKISHWNFESPRHTSLLTPSWDKDKEGELQDNCYKGQKLQINMHMQVIRAHINAVKCNKCLLVYAAWLSTNAWENALGRLVHVCVFVSVFYGVSSPLSQFKSSIQSDLLCVMSSLSAPIQLCSPNHSSMTNCLLGKQKPVCQSACMCVEEQNGGRRGRLCVCLGCEHACLSVSHGFSSYSQWPWMRLTSF